MLIKDVEDYLVQFVIKKLLVPSAEDRASGINDLIMNNEQLYLLFESLNKETTNFIETVQLPK